MYYACLNGSFNEDQDANSASSPYGGWGENLTENGEVDEAWWDYTVAVGRFPCRTTTALSNMVKKTITYMNLPEDTPYLRNVTLAGGGGGWSGETEWLANYSKSLNGTYTWWDGEETNGFDPDEWTINVLDSNPDREEGLPYTTSNSRGLFNSGTHIWYQASHGNTGGWYVVAGEGNNFLKADIQALTNAEMPSLVLSCIPCLCGDIEADTGAFGVQFLEDADGAFAGVFNTKYGWGNYDDATHGYDGLNASSHYMGSQIINAWMSGTCDRLGDMVYESKRNEPNWQEPKPDESIRWATFEQILFGDPAVKMKTYVGDNTPPVANDDYITLTRGGTTTQLSDGNNTVLNNDTDADSDPLSAIKVSDPSNGTLTLNSDGTFSYTHDGGETTTDSFTYKANDGTADSNTATVHITINDV